MKIKPGQYREELNIEKWIKFKAKAYREVSLIFLRRLAALARDFGQPMTNLIGKRDPDMQAYLYADDMRKNGSKPSGKVAKPGTSWHEYGLAVDLDGVYWRTISETFWTPYKTLEQGLNKYGLILPLNTKSGSVVEWWHLQPIETAGIPADKRKSFLDADDLIYSIMPTIRKGSTGIAVSELIRQLGSIGETYPETTVKAWQINNDLVSDGIFGPKSWGKLYERKCF